MKLKNSLVLTGVFAILLCAVAANAETTEGEENNQPGPACVERTVTVRSGYGVHYGEQDEGAVIRILDCGGSMTVIGEGTTGQGSNTAPVGNYCPPNVQDCIPK